MNDEFTPDEIRFYEDVLDRFEAADLDVTRKTPTTADAQCAHPDHPDENPSMGVDLAKKSGKARVLVNCRSRGCDVDETLSTLGMTTRDLFVHKTDFAKTKKVRPKVTGCTLEEYATAKGLGVDYLSNGFVGLEEGGRYGKPAVTIPYYGPDGERVTERFRVGLDKDGLRVVSKPGDSPPPYGLHRLHVAREAGYVLLVEGESDCHAGWSHDLPVLGIPGAKCWRDEWAAYLEGIPEVFVCADDDEAGEGLWKAVSACPALAGRAVRMVLDGAL